MADRTPALRGLGRVCRPTYRDPKTAKQKNGAVWWIEFWRDGHQNRESSKSRNVSDARTLLKQRLGEIANGSFVTRDVKRTSFEDLCQLIRDDYEKNGRDADHLDTVLNRLRSSFAELRAHDITTDKISAHQAQQKREGYANASINREMAALKRAFRLAHRAGRIASVPSIDMLDEDNARKGFFEPDQVQTLLTHLPAYLGPVFRVAYITGWRVTSELLTRQWRHVDFDHGWLRIEPGEDKSRAGRMFPFTTELREELEKSLASVRALERRIDRRVPWIFPAPDGGPSEPYNTEWRKAWKASKLPQIPHDFRRTAVRNLERAGVPRSAAMAMVGHKTESIYRRYATVEEAMLKEAAEKLSAFQTRQQAVKAKVVTGTTHLFKKPETTNVMT
jgi:integrase